jgi:hypothetical protein
MRYPSYLKLTECALYLGLTRETLRQEILAGELVAIARKKRHRTTYKVDVDAFRAYCEKHGERAALAQLNQRFPDACST